ncbi:MAG: hypothetical protein V6Z86_09405 [Hyphomicrobiales bacterium]
MQSLTMAKVDVLIDAALAISHDEDCGELFLDLMTTCRNKIAQTNRLGDEIFGFCREEKELRP